MPAQRDAARLLCLTGAILFGLCCACQAKEDGKAVMESIQKFSNCTLLSTFSFIYPATRPPRNEAELKATCRSQTDAFKCVKEKTKGSMPMIRRGLVSYVNGRARHHKKYCTNTASEPARKFVAATKCLMDKRFQAYRDNDAELIQVLVEMMRRNYTDSANELKHLCCAFHDYKRNIAELGGAECGQHKPMYEELASTIISDDLNLVCDDDEKQAKSCPKLEPLNFKRVPNYTPDSSVSASGLAIYLIATLGETES